nr:hypothetical protein [Thiocystis violacea]
MSRGGGHGGSAVRAPRGNVGGGHRPARPAGGGGQARPGRPPAGGGSGARPPKPGGGGNYAGRPPAGGGGARPPKPGGGGAYGGRPPAGGPGGAPPRPMRPPPPPVHVDNYWGAPFGAAAAVGTAIAIGAIVSSLPPGCRTVVVHGASYRQCGGNYYAPRYEGSSVVYEVVPPPY